MIHNSITFLSPILFVAGIYFYKKTKPSKVSVSLCLVMAFSSMFLFLVYGFVYYFTGRGIDEAVIYHFKYGLKGAGFNEYMLLIVLAISALVLGSIYLIQLIVKSTNNYFYQVSNPLWFLLLSASLLLNPVNIDIFNNHVNSLALINSNNSSIVSEFSNYYRKPHISVSGNVQKNIVFIYAESLERTYFDETIFPGLINGLRELETNSVHFTNITQVNGTGWTMGGVTASQCGIPLFTPSHGNSMSGMDYFLSSAVCFGDLLADNGYQLSYLGGASLDFAGKGKFYNTHGFINVLGRKELLPKIDDESYVSAWGLYDDSVFDLLYNQFMNLSGKGEKFGLFALTLGTHHPDGHPSKSCEQIKYKDGSNQMLNAVACSDHLISGFIKKILDSTYADKTVIVLASDHLALRNSAYDLLQKKERKNLFMIIDPSTSKSVSIDSLGSTLDISPTVLPFLGYTGSIGLGRNLLSNSERDEREFIHANLRNWKKTNNEVLGVSQNRTIFGD